MSMILVRGESKFRASKTGLALAGSLFVSFAAQASLVFEFNPEPGTPQEVMDGFKAAGSRWSAIIQDDVTVSINVAYAPLGAGVLGQTSYTLVQHDFASVRAALNASATSADDHSAYSHLPAGSTYSRLINRTTDSPNGPNSAVPYIDSLAPVWVTRANGKVLGIVSAPGADGTIRMNSTMGYDFNPYDGVTPGKYDFATVGAHEIAHVLGFISVVNYIEQSPGPAGSLPSTVLDLFRFSSASVRQGCIDSTASTDAKFFSVDGGATPVAPLASGSVYGTGYQADHWEAFNYVGLMDPFTPIGTPRLPRSADVRAMDVLGYRVPEPGAISIACLFAAVLGCGKFCHKRR